MNDTGVPAHGFEIELDDMHSKDITYTYDYNHYGVPKITEDNSDPLHPKVFVTYASAKNPDGTWAAYTAVPSGPIAPTQGHQFTDPTVNFGGEHFGVGYYGNPTAVKYNWLIDDGSGNLVHGPPVYVSTPTFTYSPPAAGLPAQVQAVIVPPPPPAPPPLQFGEASWVKSIKTTTHNTNDVELVDLVADDPGQPQPWANGEAPEVETEWRILQTEFGAVDGGVNGELAGAPEDLPEGDETITRRYEFYKYTGPIDAESGEAMADAVAPDGIHGVGIVTYIASFDPVTGEPVTVTTDLSTVEVVGEFFGAQMSGFDVLPGLGLIDHLQDGELNVPYGERTVVVGGNPPYLASITDGSLPSGMSLDAVTGILSGTPMALGAFTFTVNGVDSSPVPVNVSKTYTLTVTSPAVPNCTITTSALPLEGGSTGGGGVWDIGLNVTVVAVANPGYTFVNWTEGGVPVSASGSYSFTASANRNLVANFAPITYTISASVSPVAGGTANGGGTYNSGNNVTVVATANAGYTFENWTEAGVIVSASASYSFTASANRSLVANFAPITYTISTITSPAEGGITGGGGTFTSGDTVTVTATPNQGYVFINWTEGDTVVSAVASYAFTVEANRTLTANFAPVPTYGKIAMFDVASPVLGGHKTIGVVILCAAAPAGGTTVNLASSNPTVLRVPATVVIPAGRRAAWFEVSTSKVKCATAVKITATSGQSVKYCTVKVLPGWRWF